jgi:hypothetical protein
MFVWASSPAMWHTTMSGNHNGGSGVCITDWGGTYSTVRMTNTIVAYHTTGVTATTGNAAILNGTLWQANGTDWNANVTHSNDHTGDPAFAADGYHLTSGSQAVDQGIDAGVDDDVDGDKRPVGDKPDLGADELGNQYIYLPLVLRNF